MLENNVYLEKIYWHFLYVLKQNYRDYQEKENKFLENVQMILN